MDKFSDPALKQLVSNISFKGKLTVDQAYQLLRDLRDQLVPANPLGKSSAGMVFQWKNTSILTGYTVRGSRVVFDEMASFEGIVTAIHPHVLDGKISAIIDIQTPEETNDWLSAEMLSWIKDTKGNILWQDACFDCRRPALYHNGQFKPVCEYHV